MGKLDGMGICVCGVEGPAWEEWISMGGTDQSGIKGSDLGRSGIKLDLFNLDGG